VKLLGMKWQVKIVLQILLVLAEEAKSYADRTLNETEWKESQFERENRNSQVCRVFNFEGLFDCIEKARDAHLNKSHE
jgi:hypothetical protein